MIQKKHQSTALRAATSFVLLFSLIISPETSTANASANTEPNATSQQQSNNKIKLLEIENIDMTHLFTPKHTTKP